MPPSLVSEAKGPGPQITGFAEGGFRIDGRILGAALLSPEGAAAWDAPALEMLAPEHVEALLAIEPQPEFLLIGTGAQTQRPPRGFIDALEARGIGVEAMDSRAAARAWGVLRAEQRWIVAALLPLQR